MLIAALLWALAAGSSCTSCVSSHPDMLWCHVPGSVTPNGLLAGVCTNSSTAAGYVGCVNASSTCACADSAVTGCLTCIPLKQCRWVGTMDHRGVGFCAPLGLPLPLNHLLVDACPVPGIPGWSTFLIAIGGGLLLSSLLAAAARLQEYRHLRKRNVYSPQTDNEDTA